MRPSDFWQRWLAPLRLPRPLAGHGQPIGHHAEAHDLRADRRPRWRRRPRACPSRSAASATGTTASPGSGTPRSRSCALLGLGFTDEAAAFVRWIGARIRERAGERSAPLQIMYRVDGSPDLDEYDARPLRGLPGIRARCVSATAPPTRCSSTSTARHGLDALLGRRGRPRCSTTRRGPTSSAIIDWLCEHWDSPRTASGRRAAGRRTFVYGRLMSWVAFDRAIRLARTRGRPADLTRWTNERDTIYRQIMERGFNPIGQGLRPALRHRRARRVAAQDAAGRLRRPDRPDVAVDPGGHGRGAGLGQPGLPLRPRGLARRAARPRGDVLDVHLLVRRGARALGPPARTRGSSSRRCTATPTTSASTRRRSGPPGSSSATSRRPSATSPSINAAMNLGYLLDRAAPPSDDYRERP